jgi:hypothetical protein
LLFYENGKVLLDHIYTAPDPRLYFSTLRKLDYQIPQLAKPHFAALIAELRAARARPGPVQVLDIGCSYGINSALLRCDLDLYELYERYDGLDASTQTLAALVARDRELVRARQRPDQTRFVGLDTSLEALSYAHRAGMIDAVVHADLEQTDPTDTERERLTGTDLVTSTGCVGYVSERTLTRVVRASGGRPWMAHFVLRMYPFAPIAQALAEFGYHTVQVEGMFKQRQFASAEEQSLVLDTLADLGVDTRGREGDGWLYAQLFISRPVPRTIAESVPASRESRG